MGKIAIASNPMSGTDIRRIVSHATITTNMEKLNTVERIIVTAYQMGQHEFCLIHDRYFSGYHIKEKLELGPNSDVPKDTISVAPFEFTGSIVDTLVFCEYVEEENYDVLIVLGGDGTSRAAAKVVKDIPMIALSTGTNNVYPDVTEGTIAGIAASILADHAVPVEEACKRSKRIEIYRNGEFVDVALVDVAFSSQTFVGAKAIWDTEDIFRVMVTQCQPASIGFSSLLGMREVVSPDDEFGVYADCPAGDPNIRVAFAAGIIAGINLGETHTLKVGESVKYKMDSNGILALDGEREVKWFKGDELELKMTRNGPMRVDIKKTLELASKYGYFDLNK